MAARVSEIVPGLRAWARNAARRVSGDGYRIRRSPALDTRVALRYTTIRDADRGPRPYFTDNLNPPLAVDGIRFEGSLDELHVEAASALTGSTLRAAWTSFMRRPRRCFPARRGRSWEYRRFAAVKGWMMACWNCL